MRVACICVGGHTWARVTDDVVVLLVSLRRDAIAGAACVVNSSAV